MKFGLSIRFITFGADVPHRISAGELAALMKRWNALSGIVNSEPFCHSNVWRLVWPSCQTSVVPRPSTTRHDLLVEVALDIERAGARDLHHIHAPQPFGAVELDVAAAAAEPLPRRHRQILHAPHADAAIDRNALRLHEAVVGHRLAQELAKAGVLAGLGLVPVDLVWLCRAWEFILQTFWRVSRTRYNAPAMYRRCGTPVSYQTTGIGVPGLRRITKRCCAAPGTRCIRMLPTVTPRGCRTAADSLSACRCAAAA